MTYIDAEFKLLRAKHHLQEIGVFCQDWVKSDRHTCRFELDPNRPGYVVVIASATQPPVDPLSLMIGECLHNTRSALDLLAYELASAYTRPLPHEIAESSEFPIFGDEDRSGNPGVGNALFNQSAKSTGKPVRGSGRFKIRGIDPRGQDLIERLQPYQRGVHFRDDPLWRLHELDRVNKHRLLHAVTAANKGWQFTIPGWRRGMPAPSAGEIPMGEGTTVIKECVVDKDTEIGSFPLRTGLSLDDVQQQIGPALVVAFGGTAPNVELEPVLDVLASSYNYVAGTIFPTLRQLLS